MSSHNSHNRRGGETSGTGHHGGINARESAGSTKPGKLEPMKGHHQNNHQPIGGNSGDRHEPSGNDGKNTARENEALSSTNKKASEAQVSTGVPQLSHQDPKNQNLNSNHQKSQQPIGSKLGDQQMPSGNDGKNTEWENEALSSTNKKASEAQVSTGVPKLSHQDPMNQNLNSSHQPKSLHLPKFGGDKDPLAPSYNPGGNDAPSKPGLWANFNAGQKNGDARTAPLAAEQDKSFEPLGKPTGGTF